MVHARTALLNGCLLGLPAMLGLPALLGCAAAGSGQSSPAAPVPVTTPVNAAAHPAGSTAPPRQVTAKPVRGSPGKGPRVVISPTPLAGADPGSQRLVLGDRVLEISAVTERQAAAQGRVLIDLNLTVRNLGKKLIRNNSACYELIGPGADVFTYQDNSSDAFYGAVAAHAARTGMIEFEIPAAAASGLYLMYRPEIPAETVLTRLQTR